jgi:hypothetical protein
MPEKKYEKCMYPPCNKNYIPERTGKVKLCPTHADMFLFLTWFLANVKVSKEKRSQGGLILP